MNDINKKEYFSEKDYDCFATYLIEKVGLTYGQALCVVEMLSEFINTGITNALKELGVG